MCSRIHVVTLIDTICSPVFLELLVTPDNLTLNPLNIELQILTQYLNYTIKSDCKSSIRKLLQHLPGRKKNPLHDLTHRSNTQTVFTGTLGFQETFQVDLSIALWSTNSLIFCNSDKSETCVCPNFSFTICKL
jgi:hypothetical protein